MDTVHECDRRMDGRTDRITITDTVQTASHGKNCNNKQNNWSVISETAFTENTYCYRGIHYLAINNGKVDPIRTTDISLLKLDP